MAELLALMAAAAPEAAAAGTAAAAGSAIAPELLAATAPELLAASAPAWATGAGEALGGGLGAAFGAPEAAGLLGATAVTGPLSGSLASISGFPATAAADGVGMLAPYSTEAVLGAVPEAAPGAFAPQAAEATKGLSALQKAYLYGKMGEIVGQAGQRPAGAPMIQAPPQVHQQLQTQEQITKKWLAKNDPNTYARIYGSTGLMG